MYRFIHCWYSFYLYDYLFLCMDSFIDSFIAGKTMTNFRNRRTVESWRNSQLENKKVIGKMKDELNGEIIEEFVGSRLKMCSMKTKKEEMKKTKGVKKNVVKKVISHQDYVDCLFEERKFMHTMQTIRSFKHQLYTIKQNKVSLSSYDDKRYLIDDGVSSLPYGHFSLL